MLLGPKDQKHVYAPLGAMLFDPQGQKHVYSSHGSTFSLGMQDPALRAGTCMPYDGGMPAYSSCAGY